MWRVVWVDKDKLLRESFSRLKSDIEAIKEEISSLQEQLAACQQAPEDIPKNPPETRNLSESQPSLSPENLRLLIKEVIQEELAEALRQQDTKAAAVFSAETDSETEPEPKPTRKRAEDHFKEDLIKNYERNKRAIIKQQILGEASKGSFTKIALRDIVVNQKQYCSKASFYRYMDELELEGLVTYQRKKGKDLIQIKLQGPIAL
ncbi:hypothetical protein JXA12_01995 [Candidatus Woesearchaeota archaeon]|nr:hypothetical protein [Candidatus Woesearchaeota archaeon]